METPVYFHILLFKYGSKNKKIIFQKNHLKIHLKIRLIYSSHVIQTEIDIKFPHDPY